MKKMIAQLGRYLIPDTRPSRPGRWLPAFNRLGGLAGALSLLLLRQGADATIIAVQNFETNPATPTATYSATRGGFATGISTGSDRPAGYPYYSEGAQAYMVQNDTCTNVFQAISTIGYTGVQLTLRLASFSVNSQVNGADDADYVEIQISPNNGVNYYPTVRVKGNSNAYWGYTNSSGNASTAYDGDSTVAAFAPAGGGSRTTDGYSTITITSLPAVSQLRVQVIMKNDSVNERWVIDDLQITGTPNIAPTAGNNGPICAGSTLNLTASTISGATYAWTGPNGFTSALQNPTIANATTAASGTYSVTATIGGSTSSPATTSVTVNAAPATSAITGGSTAAIGQAGKVYSVTATSGSSYAWTVPSDATITAGATGPNNNQITVTFGSASGNVTATETTASGCSGAAVSQAVTVGPNHAPSVRNHTLTTLKNTAASFANAKLLAGATDADSNALTVTAAATTTAGASVVWSSTAVSYTPPQDFTGTDSYTFTVSDGNGGTAVGTVAVTVTANGGVSPNVVSGPSYSGGMFRVTFAGIPNYVYTVQYAESPSGTWSFLKYATAGADGQFEVTDELPQNTPARYYRTVRP